MTVEEQRLKLKAKFERKGWSQAKIGRALEDWEAAHARRVEMQTAPRMEFQALLRTLGSRPGGVRVLIHFYSGQFDNESVSPRGRLSLSAAELTRDGVLPEDTLVEITGHPA